MTSQPDPKDGPPHPDDKVITELANLFARYEREPEGLDEVQAAEQALAIVRAALRVLPPEGGPRPDERAIALLYFEAEKRFIEAVKGNHDGTCLGAGCSKCFLDGVQPLLDALRASGAGTRQEEPHAPWFREQIAKARSRWDGLGAMREDYDGNFEAFLAPWLAAGLANRFLAESRPNE